MRKVKLIKITPKGEVDVMEAAEKYSDALLKQMQNEVKGYIECVYAPRLGINYMMIVNDEGMLIDLPVNAVASYLYGADEHGGYIFGNALIAKNDWVDDGELDVVAVPDEEVDELLGMIKKYFKC